MSKKLTAQDEKCIQIYLENGSKKTEAFREAFAKRVRKWKPTTINTKAYEYFERGEIQDRLKDLLAKASEATEVTAEYVLQRWKDLESFDFLDVFDDVGKMKPLCDWPKAARQTVIGIETSDVYEGYGKDRVWVGTVTKLKIENRSKALDAISRHIKFFPDANVNVNLAEEVIEFMNEVANTEQGSVQGRLSSGANVVPLNALKAKRNAPKR